MAKLRRSPFKVDRIENDPEAFGRREKDVFDCAEALYNRRDVLITGPRGIGKSSLGTQMQLAYQGDNTLLKRCGISTALPHYVCAFYACDSNSTLSQLANDVLFRLEGACLAAKSVKATKTKVEFELDLSVFRARIESEVVSRQPATIATEFVGGLRSAFRAVKLIGREGINIMLDELDQLSPAVNFGHFMKMTHEMLIQDGLEDVTFTFAGQRGIYTRLIEEDASTERMVRHVPITALDSGEALYVLRFAGARASPEFHLEPIAAEMIAALSAGYPSTLHLLGDAAFSAMDRPRLLAGTDVLTGLERVLRSDKREKYLQRLDSLGADERLVLVTMSRYSDRRMRIPVKVPVDWIKKNLPGTLSDKRSLQDVLTSLTKGGHVVVNASEGICQFSEELFRVFIALLRIDHAEYTEEQLEKRRKEKQDEIDTTLMDELLSGKFGADDERRIRDTVHAMERAKYSLDWEREMPTELLEF